MSQDFFHAAKFFVKRRGSGGGLLGAGKARAGPMEGVIRRRGAGGTPLTGGGGAVPLAPLVGQHRAAADGHISAPSRSATPALPSLLAAGGASASVTQVVSGAAASGGEVPEASAAATAADGDRDALSYRSADDTQDEEEDEGSAVDSEFGDAGSWRGGSSLHAKRSLAQALSDQDRSLLLAKQLPAFYKPERIEGDDTDGAGGAGDDITCGQLFSNVSFLFPSIPIKEWLPKYSITR